jgi:hypothetical protein
MGLRNDRPVGETTGMADSLLRSLRVAPQLLRMEGTPPFVVLLGDDREAILQMSHMPYLCTLEAARKWSSVEARTLRTAKKSSSHRAAAGRTSGERSRIPRTEP